jgi:hypothetical protein
MYNQKGGNDPDKLDLYDLLFTDGYELDLQKIETITGYVQTKSPVLTDV